MKDSKKVKDWGKMANRSGYLVGKKQGIHVILKYPVNMEGVKYSGIIN